MFEVRSKIIDLLIDVASKFFKRNPNFVTEPRTYINDLESFILLLLTSYTKTNDDASLSQGKYGKEAGCRSHAASGRKKDTAYAGRLLFSI